MFVNSLNEILSFLKCEPAALFGTSDVASVPLVEVQEKLLNWISNDEQLSKFSAYNGRAGEARRLGVAEVVDRLEDGRIPTKIIIPHFEMAYYEAILRHQHANDPALARFDGEVHNRLVSEFASLDRNRMQLSRLEVVKAHNRRIPTITGIGPVECSVPKWRAVVVICRYANSCKKPLRRY